LHSAAALLGAAGLLWAAVASGSEPLHGVFALQGGTPKTDAYLVNAQAGSDGLTHKFDLWLTPSGSSAPIRSYDVDMTKMLHAVIISDDFRVFIHAHPQLEPSGHFLSTQTLPRFGGYHLYADGEPAGFGQQVFRFDFSAGPPMPNDPHARDLTETSTTSETDGGYTVKLSSLALKAGGESMLDVHIQKDGKPATDLHPYLGSLAHAVFIDVNDLTYVHVHPMPFGSTDDSMSSMKGMHGMSAAEMHDDDSASAPNMTLHVNVKEAGTYKLWLQFAGGKDLHVASFVLTAS
jgi:hypothetical protein